MNASLDPAQLARAAGVGRADNVATAKAFAPELESALNSDGLRLLVLATEPDIAVVKPPIAFDPVLTKHRFMTAIGVLRYIPPLFGGSMLERE